MSDIKIKTLLQVKQGNKIRAVQIGHSLVPSGVKIFAVNIFTGELKELVFHRSRCILLTKGELPVKALNRARAIKKANAVLKKTQININPNLIVCNYAH